MERSAIINQLKWSLQALSLKAEEQLISFPDFVVVTDELLLEFDNWYKTAIRNYPDFFTDEKIRVLNEINLFTDNLPKENLEMTIEDELKSSPFWEELRILAKEALKKFNWTSEIPPNDRTTYVHR